MAVVSASSMILRSLRLLGEKIVGGTLGTAEQTDYLADLNAMLDSWSLNRLMIPQLIEEGFALTASQGTYLIGTGKEFSTAKPLSIVAPCFVRDSGNMDRSVYLVDKIAYDGIGLKTVDGAYPSYLYYEVGTEYGTIKLFPEPAASLTLYINSWKALQQFQEITTPLMLPNGYRRAIEFNFAVEAAGGFTNVSAEVAKIARESKAAIMGFNAPSGILRLDAGVGGRTRSNIFTG